LRANVSAFGRLAMSAEFHRSLRPVPMFGAVIGEGRKLRNMFLSPDRVAALKQLRRGSSQREQIRSDFHSIPDLGRVTRVCMPIEFSNSKAREVLGWSPRFDLGAGANRDQNMARICRPHYVHADDPRPECKDNGRSAPASSRGCSDR
jgi:hypothetical protein